MLLDNTPLKSILFITEDTALAAAENYRLLMVLHGQAQVTWAHSRISRPQDTYTDNGLLLLPPYTPCQITVTPPTQLLYLEIRPASLNPGILQLSAQNARSFQCDSNGRPDLDYTPLRRLMAGIAAIYMKDAPYGSLQLTSLAYELIYLLLQEYSAPERTSNKYRARLDAITGYIESRYSQSITLESLAAYLQLSPPYVSKFFKEQFGMTFNRYINQLRFQRAVEDLKNTKDSVTDIVHKHGFPNMNAFTSMFKSVYDTTPGKFRQRMAGGSHCQTAVTLDAAITPKSGAGTALTAATKSGAGAALTAVAKSGAGAASAAAAKAEAVAASVAATKDGAVAASAAAAEIPAPVTIPLTPGQNPSMLEEYLLYSQADAIHPYGAARLEYTVDMSAAGEHIAPFWNRMFTAGKISNMASQHTANQLASLSAMGFTHAAMVQVLDSQEIPYNPHFNRYNFLAFDHAINTLHMNNLIPYLELNPDMGTLTKNNFEIDMDDYMQRLKGLLHHCQRLYNPSNVNRWMFDMGFCHDLTCLRHETPAHYVRRFIQGYRCIKQTFPNAQVGGTGFFLAYPQHLLEKIIDGLAQAGVMPDFISLVYYPYRFSGHGGPASGLTYLPDTGRLVQKLAEIKTLLRKYRMKKTEILISHLSADHLHRLFYNDTCYQSAFLLHTTMALAGHTDFAGFDQISDTAMEARTAHFTDGRSGFFTGDNLPKPGYFAMDFLSRMGDVLLSRQEHMLITRGTGGNYAILLDNYTAPGAYYCQNPFINIRPKHTYTIFDNPSVLNVTMTLDQLDNGFYKTVTHRLNREHGSIFDTWQKMNYWVEAIRGDTEYFRQVTRPEREYRYVQVTGRQLRLNMTLTPHETVLIEMFPEIH